MRRKQNGARQASLSHCISEAFLGAIPDRNRGTVVAIFVTGHFFISVSFVHVLRLSLDHLLDDRYRPILSVEISVVHPSTRYSDFAKRSYTRLTSQDENSKTQ